MEKTMALAEEVPAAHSRASSEMQTEITACLMLWMRRLARLITENVGPSGLLSCSTAVGGMPLVDFLRQFFDSVDPFLKLLRKGDPGSPPPPFAAEPRPKESAGAGAPAGGIRWSKRPLSAALAIFFQVREHSHVRSPHETVTLD